MTYVNKETLRQMWRKGKAYTDEKVSAVPDSVGYWDGGKLILDNLDEGEYYLSFTDAACILQPNVKIAITAENKSFAVQLPEKCTHIHVLNSASEKQGTVRVSKTGGVQSDLSVNDETAPSYVKNRTHWSETSIAEILPQTDFPYMAASGNFYLNTTAVFEIGKNYIVGWNGKEYYCTAIDYQGAACLGNTVVVGGTDTGEPFAIMCLADQGVIAGYSVDGSTNVALSIKEDREMIHKLNNKYLDLEWLPAEKPVLLANKRIDGDDENTVYILNTIRAGNLHAGDKLTVFVNDKHYDTVVFGDAENIFAGNKALIDDSQTDTGEPFILMLADGSFTIVFAYTNPHINGTISVYGYELDKMPERYLPESVESIIIRSSTADSTKLFEISVDDTGVITVKEVAE